MTKRHFIKDFTLRDILINHLAILNIIPGDILRLEGLHVEDSAVGCVLICVIVNVDLAGILFSISLRLVVSKKSHFQFSGTVFF